MKLPQINIKNRRAAFDYELLDTYTAGIVLTGTEIKSIRLGKAGLSDTFCYFNNGELWVKNMYIAEYANRGYESHIEKRDRKLLLTRREINGIIASLSRKGTTLVAIRLYFNDKGRAKLEIGLGTGKKLYDKRETVKQRDWNRDKRRIMAGR